MTALLGDVTWPSVAAMGLTLLGVALVVGAVAGQFRRGVVTELRESLSSSATENELLRGRLDRMEKDLVAIQAEVHALSKENAALREVIVSRNDLDERLLARLDEGLQKQTRRLVDVLRETA